MSGSDSVVANHCDAPFDLALVDVQMPRLDGIEVVTRWREEEHRRARGESLTMASKP